MQDEQVVEDAIKLVDISGALSEMPEPRGFILPDDEQGIRPQFAKEITAIFHLMHWPFINEVKGEVLDKEMGITSSGFSMYAALLPHGKKYVAEIFIASEVDQAYQGTIKAYSVEFPGNIYDEGYDDWLMSELARSVTGVTKESVLTHSTHV